MNALGAVITLIFALGALFLPRRGAALAVVAGICYITQGQTVIVGGFHFFALRIVLLAAIVRAFARGEIRALASSPIDKALLRYVGVASLLYIVREGTTSAAVSQFGIIYNILLSYFAFRSLLSSQNDVEEFLAGLAIFIVPLALMFAVESMNGANRFSLFGAVNAMDEYRNGHYRCSGAFRSPITAGTFGATLMPLFVALYLATKHRRAAIVGVVAATVITVSSRSGGPAIEFLSALFGWVLWRWRQHTRLMRRGFVVSLIVLNMVMKAPVWFLMGHVSDLIGGGGWHRAEIIDAAVNHLRSWWMWGTNATGDWVATQLTFGGADLTNQYVSEGVNAGLPGMLLFIWIIVRGFQNLGLGMKKVSEEFPQSEKFLWGLGVTLFATVVNFFSVSYFDQIGAVWYLVIAMIASATSDVVSTSSSVATQEELPRESGEVAVEFTPEMSGTGNFRASPIFL